MDRLAIEDQTAPMRYGETRELPGARAGDLDAPPMLASPPMAADAGIAASVRSSAPSEGVLASRKVASSAILSVAIGASGFALFGLITGPLAIRFANRALAGTGDSSGLDNYQTLARVGRMLGYVATGLWAMATLLLVGYLLSRG